MPKSGYKGGPSQMESDKYQKALEKQKKVPHSAAQLQKTIGARNKMLDSIK